MKCSLSTMTKYISCVISLKGYDNEEVDLVIENLNNWCSVFSNQYAFILHNKDINEDGELKTPHIHLIAILKSNKKRLSTTISDISEIIGVSTLAISIEKLSDFSCGLQYLVHKNNLDKYQYSVSDIYHNMTNNEFDIYYNSDKPTFSVDLLINSVKLNHGVKSKILIDIGLSYYHNYQRVINDLIEDYKRGLL